VLDGAPLRCMKFVHAQGLRGLGQEAIAPMGADEPAPGDRVAPYYLRSKNSEEAHGTHSYVRCTGFFRRYGATSIEELLANAARSEGSNRRLPNFRRNDILPF